MPEIEIQCRKLSVFSTAGCHPRAVIPTILTEFSGILSSISKCDHSLFNIFQLDEVQIIILQLNSFLKHCNMYTLTVTINLWQSILAPSVPRRCDCVVTFNVSLDRLNNTCRTAHVDTYHSLSLGLE